MRFSGHLDKHQAEGRHSPGGLRVTLGFCSSQEEMKREKSIAVGPTIKNAMELCTVVVCTSGLVGWANTLSYMAPPSYTFCQKKSKMTVSYGKCKAQKSSCVQGSRLAFFVLLKEGTQTAMDKE